MRESGSPPTRARAAGGAGKRTGAAERASAAPTRGSTQTSARPPCTSSPTPAMLRAARERARGAEVAGALRAALARGAERRGGAPRRRARRRAGRARRRQCSPGRAGTRPTLRGSAARGGRRVGSLFGAAERRDVRLTHEATREDDNAQTPKLQRNTAALRKMQRSQQTTYTGEGGLQRGACLETEQTNALFVFLLIFRARRAPPPCVCVSHVQQLTRAQQPCPTVCGEPRQRVCCVPAA